MGMTDCSATMESVAIPGHTHRCLGNHSDSSHFCGECRRWWYREIRQQTAEWETNEKGDQWIKA